MMSEPKPMASLSSGLLARKGAAKPAMRPQGFGHVGPAGIEDLGWNDMGYVPPAPAAPEPDDLPRHVPSSISALTPAPKLGPDGQPLEAREEEWDEEDEGEEEAAAPPVVEQQRAIAASFTKTPIAFEAPEPEPEIEEPELPAPAAIEAPAPVVVSVPQSRAVKGAKGKAAFTLRLDPDRHLKLRLACAVTHRSAQQIVSGALDDYLQSLPELDAMAERMPAKRS
jgi:predicted transcriptional regulator